MSRKHDSFKTAVGRRPAGQILFAAVSVMILTAAVCAAVWLAVRDTPAKTVRSTMKQIASLDESALLQIAEDEGTSGDSEEAIPALSLFFREFSGRVISVSKNKDTADVIVRITTPDARALASDIRLLLLKDSCIPQAADHPEASDHQDAPDTDRIYSLMKQCLSEQDYPLSETEGTIRVDKTQDGWAVTRTSGLSSLLLGGFPEALADPWLLSSETVLSVFLEKLDSASAEEWAVLFGVNDLFSTYAANAAQIDMEFLTRAKEAFSWSDVRADTSGSHSDVSLTVTGIDTGAILQSCKEKLASYGRTVDAASADSYDVSRKSASLLLESIMENESTAEFPVTVSMENDGTGWNITDSSALTDACFGGMAEAVEEFRKEDSADG